MSLSVKRMITLITFSIFISMFAATALARNFSADIYSSDDGKTINKQKIYTTADKIRVETDEMATITRLDKKLIWILTFEDKMYTEQPINLNAADKKQVHSTEPPSDEVEKVFVLRETINGYVSDKYRVTLKNQDAHYIWLSSDPGITMRVKTAAIDGSWWQEFRNIKFDEPAAALFEVPPGYQKMSMHGIPGSW